MLVESGHFVPGVENMHLGAVIIPPLLIRGPAYPILHIGSQASLEEKLPASCLGAGLKPVPSCQGRPGTKLSVRSPLHVGYCVLTNHD